MNPTPSPTPAEPLRGISSMATRLLLAELAPAWSAETGQPLAVDSVGGVDAATRVAGGDALDLAILSDDALARLQADGHLAGDIVPVAGSDMAAALPPGTPAASIADSRDGLVRLLREAPAIGYSTGPSGKALLALLQDWGLLDELRPRLLQAPPGTPVGGLVAEGRVAIGFQQRSELVHIPGIAVAAMPPGARLRTVFAAAVCRQARQPQAAAAFIAWLREARHAAARQRQGLSDPA